MRSLIVSVLLVAGVLLAGCASSNERQELGDLKVGDPAPDFTLPDQDGKPVTLSQFRGDRTVVLYFYPKDDTQVCTTEACSFRDSYEVFTDAGATVIGVSGDSAESHRDFIASHNLPFTLLCDEEGKVRELYRVPSTLGLPGRVTFVIDRQGVVRFIYSSMFNAEGHVAEALRVIQELAAK